MASDDQEDVTVSFALPAEVDDWVDRLADEHGEPRESIYRQLLATTHSLVMDDETELVDSEDLESVRTEFIDHVEDARERVIQVKRETDAKAPADHDHPEYAPSTALSTLEERLESQTADITEASTAVDELTDDFETLEGELETLEETVNAGFDNFEEILEYLLAETDRLEDRSTLLAAAVADLQEHRKTLAARERRRSEADRLKLAANRLGITTATCEECNSKITIGLLTVPECPHCASSFADVEAKTSIFGSHTLLTGDPPALRGRADAATQTGSEDVFDAVEESATEETGRPSPEIDRSNADEVS